MPSLEIAYDPADELFTVHQVARRLRVDDTTVRRWITGGRLRAVRLPHGPDRVVYRIRKAELDALFEPVL